MQTNDSSWLNRAMRVIANYDPALASEISQSPNTVTVIDNTDQLRDMLAPVEGWDQAVVVAKQMGEAFGMTVRPDPYFPTTPFDGDVWLNREQIVQKSNEFGWKIERFAADVLVHEWQHHRGMTDTDAGGAFDAGTAFAAKMGEDSMAEFSDTAKNNQSMMELVQMLQMLGMDPSALSASWGAWLNV